MTTPPGETDAAAVTEYTVGAVARRLGVPVATLRSWNRRYGIGPQQHRPGKHRHYTGADLAVAARMISLIRAGASPSSAAQAARAVLEPAPPTGDTAPLLAAAEAMDVTRLLNLLAAHLAHHGVATTWNLLCRPTFAEIVGRQQDGDGWIDVEHLLTWAITTSLHRCVPPLVQCADEPEIVLACTPGEHHVLPLEVLRAGLAERGRATLLLGASVPADALAQALSRRGSPATVVLWSQSPHTAAAESLRAVEDGQCPLYVAGPGWTGTVGPRHLRSLEEAVAVLC